MLVGDEQKRGGGGGRTRRQRFLDEPAPALCVVSSAADISVLQLWLCHACLCSRRAVHETIIPPPAASVGVGRCKYKCFNVVENTVHGIGKCSNWG